MISKLGIEWKRPDFVSLSGEIDEHSDFSGLTKHNSRIVYMDLHDIQRLNSSGVRKWVWAIENMKDSEIHYINCSIAIVEQLSMVPEFIGKKSSVESFDARYVCEECNSTHIITLVVGYDIEPGLPHYDEGPQKDCPSCKGKLEFDHNPDSYFFFLSKLPKKHRK